MEKKHNDFFWPSYVDVLTALFVAILVLFVLVFKISKDKIKITETQGKTIEKQADSLKTLRVLASQAERIEMIDKQIAALEQKNIFEYDPLYKRFLVKAFKGREIFDSGSYVIRNQFTQPALDAGKEIRNLINSFRGDKDISFVLLIEGNTALKHDGSMKGSIDGNYELSYKRSLALVSFWKQNNIDFNDGSTELIIAGSGIYGVGRDQDQNMNKRFLIQVIPKIKK